MSQLIYPLALLASLAGGSVHADLALADKNACLNCHALETRLVGPSFKAIASKYRTQPDAAVLLAGKVEKGSGGVWGNIAMPPMGGMAKEDVQTLVAWILKQP